MVRSPFTGPSFVLRVRVDRKDKRRTKRNGKSERKCTTSFVPWWFHVRLLCVHQIFTCAQNYLWLFLMLTFASALGHTCEQWPHSASRSLIPPAFRTKYIYFYESNLLIYGHARSFVGTCHNNRDGQSTGNHWLR